MDHSDFGTEHENTAPDSAASESIDGATPAAGNSEGSGAPAGVPVGGEGSTRISYDAPGSAAGPVTDASTTDGSYTSGSYSSGGDDDGDDDDYSTEYASSGSYSSESYAPEPEEAPPEPINLIDLANDEIPSFGALMQARPAIFDSERALLMFHKSVDALSTEGELGRRRGLGLWMLGRYEEAVEALASHGDDDVAAYTSGRSLVSLGRAGEAVTIFKKLSDKYPDEPRPKGDMLDAQLDHDLSKGDVEAAVSDLEKALAGQSDAFGESAEGHHLKGRIAELSGDYQEALECYQASRAADPTHRRNLFRLAYLSERTGQEQLALDAYETLAMLLPVDRSVMINLGVLYEDFGRDQDAASCYDTIARTDPADRLARLYLEDAKAGMSMYYDEDLEKKEDRLNQILRIPITDFELSVRARNCLNKMDIMTLGDLVKKTESELLSYKNFGETSLTEIKEILASKGLRLGMAREEAVASIAKARNAQEGRDLDPNDPRNKSISELKLSIRARRTVENLGCLTLGDVTQHSEEELLGMPNFGVTSLQELKQKLSEMNLKLKPKK